MLLVSALSCKYLTLDDLGKVNSYVAEIFVLTISLSARLSAFEPPTIRKTRPGLFLPTEIFD